MKFQLTLAEGKLLVTAYGSGWIEINRERHETSLILTPDQVAPWAAQSVETLDAVHFEAVTGLAPEVLLIGTGERLRFPPPALLRPLIEAGIGYEVMDTGAACRTYNILMSDDRKVVAALII